MEGGKRISKGTLALLADIAVQLGLILASGGVRLETGLPFGELSRVGIDSLDLLCEVFESGSGLGLLVGGLAFVGVLYDIRLLYAVADTIDDFVASLQCAVDVGNGGRWVDFCHGCVFFYQPNVADAFFFNQPNVADTLLFGEPRFLSRFA